MNRKFACTLIALLLFSAIPPRASSIHPKEEMFSSTKIHSEILSQNWHSQNMGLPDPLFLPAEPVKINWKILQSIEFDLKYIPELELSMYTPLFTDEVKALDGKEVIIEGYVIPMYEEGNEVALSANSYASCFFCGQAGPASVMSIFLQKKAGRFKLDDIRTFRGTLKLNYDNPDEFYYSLQDAVME